MFLYSGEKLDTKEIEVNLGLMSIYYNHILLVTFPFYSTKIEWIKISYQKKQISWIVLYLLPSCM